MDNAWDADAPNVWISLPDPMTLDPIVVRDYGTGMTERELRQEYLKVPGTGAQARGERTPGKRRLVKGRKGIGKFAGLMVSEIMTVETSARSQTICLTIPKQELLSSTGDLEKLPLPLTTAPCDVQGHGTTITFFRLHHQRTPIEISKGPILEARFLSVDAILSAHSYRRATDPLVAHEHLAGAAIRSYYFTSSEVTNGNAEVALWGLGFTPEVFQRDKKRGSKGVDIALTKVVLSHGFRDNYDAAAL